MSNKVFAILLLVILAAGVAGDKYFTAAAKRKTVSERTYPKPSYVRYETKLNDEQLMFLARQQARQTETRDGSLGNIEPGKKGLMTLKREQDMKVVEACIRALRERGADADYIYTDDLLEKYGYPRSYAKLDEEIDPINQSDLHLVVEGIQHYNFPDFAFSPAGWAKMPNQSHEIVNDARKRYHARNDALVRYLKDHPEFDYVFVEWFSGGPMVQEMSNLFGRKFRNAWRLPTMESLVRQGSIPQEVWRALEQKALVMIPWIRHVHITDPEGTDFQFTLTAEDAKYWTMGAFYPDYIRVYPMQSGRWLYRSLGVKHVVVPEEANGVIAGTVGHMGGVIPHLTLTIKNGQVANAEGGGLQGYLMNDIRERFKDVHLPYLPDPGWLYVFQLSMPVNPKNGARNITWGFGAEIYIPDTEKYAAEHHIPITHDFHLDNSFPTYEATVTGGKKQNIIEKGHLMLLDNPEVRAIASKYGDADEILREEGARPIPGINAPGDYWKDYAQDPAKYWAKERGERKSGKSRYMVTILPFQLRGLQPQTAQQEAANRVLP
jgi:hypothetical protein